MKKQKSKTGGGLSTLDEVDPKGGTGGGGGGEATGTGETEFPFSTASSTGFRPPAISPLAGRGATTNPTIGSNAASAAVNGELSARRNSNSNPTSSSLRRGSQNSARGGLGDSQGLRDVRRGSTTSAPFLGAGSNTGRRDSILSDITSASMDEILERAPRESSWHSVPLAFAVLPAVAGLLVKDAGHVVTDFLLLALGAVFLRWMVKVPW